MKLLIDQDLSHRLVLLLATEYPDPEHVRDVGMNAADDSIIWQYAANHRPTIVSEDSDFQQRALLYGHPPKVVWLRLGNCSTSSVIHALRARQAELETFQSDPVTSYLILS